MRLKELRKSEKLKQCDIAKELNVSQTCYANYENGKREPSIDTLCKLADIYHVSLDYLVGREFANEIGYLSDEQKNVVLAMKQLNNSQLNEVLGIILRMIDERK